MDHHANRPLARPRRWWTPTRRRAAGRLGAYGAFGAIFIGACAPAVTQCTPAPPPPPPVDIPLAAKPVQPPCTFTDTFGAPRAGGRTHEGTDIMAAEGTPLFAVVTGTITKLYTAGVDLLAGNGLKITQADGTYFFYAHLSALAPGIAVGTPVTAGQLVGWVGHTGDAGVPHLHFEIHPDGGAAIDPYPILLKYGAC